MCCSLDQKFIFNQFSLEFNDSLIRQIQAFFHLHYRPHDFELRPEEMDVTRNTIINSDSIHRYRRNWSKTELGSQILVSTNSTGIPIFHRVKNFVSAFSGYLNCI